MSSSSSSSYYSYTGNNRPFINIITDDDYGQEGEEPNPADFCPFCHVRLTYLQRDNIYFCDKCGWNFPRPSSPSLSQPVLGGQQQQQQQSTSSSRGEEGGEESEEEGGPMMACGRPSNYNNTNCNDYYYDDNPVPVTWGKSRNEQIRNRLDPESNDPEHPRLVAKGYRLLRESTHQPYGDAGAEDTRDT